MSIPNILQYIHGPDLVSPVEAALRLHESRLNEETQRMFAQNQMQRQSAQEFREERDHAEKMKELERQHGIEQATALQTANQMLRTPGGAGPAMALAGAYGIDLHPLLATTAAAHAPTGDAVDQFLASQSPGADGGAPGSSAAPAPVVGPAGAGAPPPEPAPMPAPGPGEVDPGVAAIMMGRQVQSAPEGDFVLPKGAEVSRFDPIAQGAADEGYVPPGSELLPPGPRPATPAPAPSPGVPSPDLERLMVGSMAPQIAASRQEAPTNPLYEAVLGGHHYQLGGGGGGTGLGGKYDAVFNSYLGQGAKPAEAFKAVLAEKEKDDAQAAMEHRLTMGIDLRDVTRGKYTETVAQKEAERAKYHLTADQQMTLGRLRAAAAGAASPHDQQVLAQLITMAENGADKGEIAQVAADNKLQPKVWEAPVHQVGQEANQNTRTTERRAAMEVTDVNGKVLGTAHSPQTAALLTKQEQAFGQMKQRLTDLIADVREKGSRTLSPDEIQRRNSLFSLYTAAARQYNGLGATDASQRLEAETAGARGTPGHGILFGANLGVLEHLLQEAEASHKERLNVGLRSGGGRPLPAAVTHEKPSTGGTSLTPAQQSALPDGWRVAD